ncbi:Protein kinase-like domain [Penicillium digitatum]|uniref:Protein kinase domain-containing protein n=3 Tax=Penicillium digitatum TaxID=36651 RepID=K9FRX8_PEND2|nr:hypothetical protein PDIP_87260 [Penicillium digitatum Pd1]EKV04502.1 hypothetical protein PDIP_87260 [Penicillium digitatum Pd1]EKV05493.1 hypothetical protein PDIG_83450 [Penicillium digitatum PHI26]QQK45650.1 Protein kinase-like domain [Penicillium digitatum]
MLKVFPPYKWDRCHPPLRSIDLFKNESRAYNRLKARGFCERGYVPEFYGVVENIDPEAKGWQSDLKKFYDRTFPRGLDPTARPNGVLMEARKLHQLLIEIHEAGIVHLALYPRNMLIQGDTDRVLLIDYDLAQIFDPEHPEHPRFFTRERDLMDDFVEALGRDHNLEKYEETRTMYFE